MPALHTGQRQGDPLRLPWSASDGTTLALKRSETGARVSIPCTAALRAMLDALPRGDSGTLPVNQQGRPRTSDAFERAWAKAAGGDAFERLRFDNGG